MSKTVFNADEHASLFPVIEIVLGGKTYTVQTVTFDMLQEVSKLSSLGGENSDSNMVIHALSNILGAQPDDLRQMDVRVLGKVLSFVMEKLTAEMEPPKGNAEAQAALPTKEAASLLK